MTTCPHCGYTHLPAWADEYVEAEDKGEFYCLPVYARREGGLGYSDEETVYFCPKCGKGFIEVRG